MEKMKMKILVGICTGGTIHAQTAVSLISMLDRLKQEGNISYEVSIQIGGNKTMNMNRLAREAVDKQFDYLMSIDNDMIFQPDAIIRLLDSDKDIVGGNYSVRGNSVEGHPKESVIKMTNKQGQKIATTTDNLPKQLFKCNSLGNGFTLYKTKLFTEMTAPWFEDGEDKDGNWSGEDVLFHERAQVQGYEVWCNPKIDLGHIGTFDYRIT